MSMPLSFATKVSLFSMRRRLIRTVLSLLPCVLLIAVLFIGSTIPNGLVQELDKKVLKTAEARQEIVVLSPYLFQSYGAFNGSSSKPSSTYNQEAYQKATTAPQVEQVFPQRGTISGTASAIGDVDGAMITFGGTTEPFTKLYSDKAFSYTPGKPIPVLLNPASIGAQKYVWGDSDTLEIDYSKPEEVEKNLSFQQIKNPDTLVGKQFTVTFGQFPSYPEAFEESKQSGFGPPKSKLTKLTDQDRQILDRRVNEIYSPYWDVDQLRQPVQYTFEVIGIIRGQDAGSQAFIPNEAVVSIWSSLYERQANARTGKVLDKDLLSSENFKTEVKESYIDTTGGYIYPMPTWQKDPSVSAWQVQMQTVGVTGLFYTTTTNARGDAIYEEAPRMQVTLDNFRSDAAVVKLHSADDREGYIKYLADSGLQFYDASPLSAIKSIRKASNIAVTWLTIILGTIVAFILLTTVSRFVADSRKEIGVWRAIGATRFDIVRLVLVRMLWLLIFGIGVGVVIGLAVSIVLAGVITHSVNSATASFNPYTTVQGSASFIGQIVVSMLGGFVPTIDQKALLATNWGLLGSRLGLLSIITLVIGLIPALRAARISPITAIRDSD